MGVEKLYLTNSSALERKYGSAGAGAVFDALSACAAADKERGLESLVVALDSASAFAASGGSPVESAKHEMSNKRAVDVLFKHYSPDYMALVGGPDIIPHVLLNNPTRSQDNEPEVPSDLPYASAAAHSRHIKNFVAVTRVVGRIPDIPGARNPEYLLKLLAAYRAHKPAQPGESSQFFSITADVWAQSTEESLLNLFGNGAGMLRSPGDTASASRAALARKWHFINCHGTANRAAFLGQAGNSFPEAMNSGDLAGAVSPGTMVAAECCYGAALFDPDFEDFGRMPVPLAYLGEGASGYLGSTNIAYGPASGNGAADLVTQWFLRHLLAGESTGMALLLARQEFVDQGLEDPVNLKTLGQFLLLGDPSLYATASRAQTTAYVDPAIARSSGRAERRANAIAKGLSQQAAASYVTEEAEPVTQRVRKQMEKFASEFEVPIETMQSFPLTGGPGWRKSMKFKNVAPIVVVGGSRRPVPGMEGATKGELLVARAIDDRVVSVRHYLER